MFSSGSGFLVSAVFPQRGGVVAAVALAGS